MKFVCNKALLTEAVAGVSRAVTVSNAVPILQGILVKADGFKLTLTGYDLQMAIVTSIEAEVIEPGEIVFQAKLLSDMLRGLANDDVVFEVSENLSTHIKSGITEYDLNGMNASDFPELPVPGADPAFKIDAAEFANMINSTIYAVSTDEKKPAHTGQLFSIIPGELTVVSLDGFRLAIIRHPIISDREINIVVPAKTAIEAARLMADCGEEVQVDANNRYVVFSAGKYIVISRLIEGEFLNYKNVVPENSKTSVIVDVAPFEKSIERCSVIITERIKNPLRITFDDEIKIKCETPLGKVKDKIEAEIEGEKVEIGFNYRYLLDALKNSRCDKVKIELSGELSPVKIMPTIGDEFLFLVLPVRFKND